MKLRLAALLACMALSAPLAAQQFDTISFGVDGGYPPFDVLAPAVKLPVLILISPTRCAPS